MVETQPYQHARENHKRQQQSRRGPHRHQNARKRRRGPPQSTAPASKPSCFICNNEEKPPGYKCPKCRALYCSVACCKEHKTICPGAPPEPTTKQPSSPWKLDSLQLPLAHQGHRGDEEEDLDEGWKLTEEMKESVERSDWLRQQLQDGGLRDLIRQLVASGNPEALQQVQQRFPQFQMFLDKLLVVAGVLEREQDPQGDDKVAMEPLEEWLARDWSQDPPQLSLKQLRRKMPIFQPVDASASSSEDDEEEEASSRSSSNSSDAESGKSAND